MESMVERQYRDYTRYLKPLRPISFTDLEMMQSLMQSVDPEEVASVAQLLGHRRGVIRITFKTSSGVERLEQAVQRRRLAIGDVPLGLVDNGGQFIVVTLDNVPHYIPDEQVRQLLLLLLLLPPPPPSPLLRLRLRLRLLLLLLLLLWLQVTMHICVRIRLC